MLKQYIKKFRHSLKTCKIQRIILESLPAFKLDRNAFQKLFIYNFLIVADVRVIRVTIFYSIWVCFAAAIVIFTRIYLWLKPVVSWSMGRLLLPALSSDSNRRLLFERNYICQRESLLKCLTACLPDWLTGCQAPRCQSAPWCLRQYGPRLRLRTKRRQRRIKHIVGMAFSTCSTFLWVCVR